MARAVIPERPFRHNVKPGLGFEIFRLRELFARAERAGFLSDLLAPERTEFHMIQIGLRGSGSLIVDFMETPLGADTLTVLAAGRVRQFVPVGGVDAWMLLVSPEFLALGTDRREVDLLRGAIVLSPTWPVPALSLAAADRRDLLALCEQLAAEHARPLDAVQPALLAALLRAVLLRAERIALAAADAAGRPVPPPELQRFFTILERDCLITRSVAHYARGSGISTRRLGELLQLQTGRSTKQVIDERVVLEQKRLLAHTDIAVKELAERTGFDEPTNLVKFFRHHAGVTPLEFRANSMFSPSRRRS